MGMQLLMVHKVEMQQLRLIVHAGHAQASAAAAPDT